MFLQSWPSKFVRPVFHATKTCQAQKTFLDDFRCCVPLKNFNLSRPDSGENANVLRNWGDNGFWSFRANMDFARAPRKKVENDGENGSGVPKPPYSFTFAKVENRLALNQNVFKGRRTRFRSQPFVCTHSTTPYGPFPTISWPVSAPRHIVLSPREHLENTSRSKHPCLGCLTKMMKWIFSVPTGQPGKCIVVVVSIRSRTS